MSDSRTKVSQPPAPFLPATSRGVPQWCWVVALALVLLKLVLVSHEEIVAFTDDDYGYAHSAFYWYWKVPYGTFSFSRQPVYPLFLAASDVFGIPARLWIELTWAGAAGIMLVALRRLGLTLVAALAAFVLVLFHPWTVMLFSRFLCDSLYGALLLPFLCALAVGITRTNLASALRWGSVAAVSGALAANTRVESILILGAVAVAGACVLGLYLAREADRRLSLRRGACVVLLPLVAIFGLTHAFKAANLAHIGSYVTSDLDMPGFKMLYGALLAIRPAHPDVRLSAPRDAREWAYARSPAFAQLRPFLESDPAVLGYTAQTEAATGVKGEYGAWTVWGLRVAAWHLHPWQSARELDAFYAKAGDEILAALKAEPGAARWTPVTFVPPDWGQMFRELPASGGRCWRMLLFWDYWRHPDSKLDEAGTARFDAVGNRRLPLVLLNNEKPVEGAVWASAKNAARLDRYKRSLFNLLKPVTIAAVVLLVAGTLVGVLGARRRVFPASWYVLSALLISAALGRFAIVALLDVTGIPVLMRYLFPLAAPIMILGVLNAEALLALAAAVWRKRSLRRKSADQG